VLFALPSIPSLSRVERARRTCPALLAVWLCLLAVGATPPLNVDAVPAPLDRQAVEAELSRQLQLESADQLQARLRRLAEFHAALEAADVPGAERKALSDRVLLRMAEIGLLLRSRDAGIGRPRPAPGAGRVSAVLAGLVEEGSGLLVVTLGGLVVCFALGSLAGYRRGARHASYYGEGDPRLRFAARPHADPRLPTPRVTLEQIRRRLHAGHPVLFQLGYEIEPSHRARFLAAVTEMQAHLQVIEGQSLTVWEDPRHSNRFYECLECRDLAALDRLVAVDGPQADLAAEVEACRPRNGWIVRRAWWGVGPTARGSRSAST
jgi:hypothetical protein